MNTCMLMGPTSGCSETKEYHLLSQFQLPFARNIIAYVLRTCDNLVGVMVFGHKAADNILPWLHMNFSQKFLIQSDDLFLSLPQNIKWRYTYNHARNYVEMFGAIMALLGVDIPTLEGVVQLNFLLTKKRTLEMMECVEELLVDGEVIEAVHQRIEKVKIARKAKVDEMMEALKPGQRQPNGSRLLQTLEANHPVSCCAATWDAAGRSTLEYIFARGVCKGHD